ncbi:MAG: hypothetical protein JRN20_09470 [Nitrososphaerota archaeon]|nr:hypothetical protein [Nitrososphaerota archaeon]
MSSDPSSQERNASHSKQEGRRKKLNRKILTAVVALVVATMLSAIVGVSYQQQEVSGANSHVTSLNSQISLLRSQNGALQNETTALASRLRNLSQNNSMLMLKANNFASIIGLNRSVILVNDVTASQPGGNFSNPGFTFWNNFTSSIRYAGYVVITIHSSNASDCMLEASWNGYGANVTQAWHFGSSSSSSSGVLLNNNTLNVPGSAVLPVLPTSSLQIGVINLAASESVENVSVAYYF